MRNNVSLIITGIIIISGILLTVSEGNKEKYIFSLKKFLSKPSESTPAPQITYSPQNPIQNPIQTQQNNVEQRYIQNNAQTNTQTNVEMIERRYRGPYAIISLNTINTKPVFRNFEKLNPIGVL